MKVAKGARRQVRIWRRLFIRRNIENMELYLSARALSTELRDLSLAFQAAAPVAFEEYHKSQENVG